MKKALLIFLVGVMAFASCKKDKVTPAQTQTTDGNTVPTTGTTLDKIKDSVYLYAKEDYYWYDALPDYATFKPRSFTGTDDADALSAEVNAISQYKINPATGKPYEYYAANPGEAKYSFIDEGEVSTKLSAVTGDFGFGLFYPTNTDLRIKYVSPGSPADLAGIKRGYQIISINGRTNLSYDNGPNADYVVNAYSKSSTITMILKKPDGSQVTVTLNTATYTNNPVFASSVIDVGNGKKIGYIVFNSFVTLSTAKPKLDEVFNNFKASNITDLVVDLRYNGGGYVETAEYLDNLIAPPSVNNGVMYAAYYNDILQSGKEKMLKFQTRKDDATGKSYNYSQVDYSVAGNTVKFGTTHPFNLSRVFFIVTGSTASASELTINNLRPYMNVQLIGTTSYGKPVGFFDIDINKYQMYIPEFETKNSQGQGGYYAGMRPGSTDYPGYYAADDVTREFGDQSEALLASAISYITKGSYTSTAASVQSIGAKTGALSIEEQTTAGLKLDKDKFKGMLFKTHKHN